MISSLRRTICKPIKFFSFLVSSSSCDNFINFNSSSDITNRSERPANRKYSRIEKLPDIITGYYRLEISQQSLLYDHNPQFSLFCFSDSKTFTVAEVLVKVSSLLPFPKNSSLRSCNKSNSRSCKEVSESCNGGRPSPSANPAS
uniref:Uncharacterized protein n=1 Tax=Glossina brevipalpis TaxID=37001 RepID=A0A1A9WYN7_9MUSC